MAKTRLPDFGDFFTPANGEPLFFEARRGANFFHDIVFLSGYLHDAIFELKQIKIRNGVLSIELDRDRWELYRRGQELPTIRSKLTIRPVLKCELRMNLPPSRFQKGKFEIRRVRVEDLDDRSGEAYFRITLDGASTCGCSLIVETEEWPKVVLKDNVDD